MSTAMNTIESRAIQPNVYYTLEETADLLRVSQQAVSKLLQSQRINDLKIGKQWRILGAALLNLSERWETEAALVSDWLQASTVRSPKFGTTRMMQSKSEKIAAAGEKEISQHKTN